MGKAVMADSIASLPEFKAWYNVIKDTLAEFDLSQLLVYVVDTVDASALPYLAEQFDVLGYKGMRIAQTETDQREIIKRAIELHRYKGTEWAIKQALLSIGFSEVELIKGIEGGFDHWAKFSVVLTNRNVTVTPQNLADITNMVLEYKRAVCVLQDIRVNILVEDTLTVSNDTATVVRALEVNDNLKLTDPLIYDGTHDHDASHNYSGDTDVVTIT